MKEVLTLESSELLFQIQGLIFNRPSREAVEFEETRKEFERRVGIMNK